VSAGDWRRRPLAADTLIFKEFKEPTYSESSYIRSARPHSAGLIFNESSYSESDKLRPLAADALIFNESSYSRAHTAGGGGLGFTQRA
jgi:hypothetical protein